MWLVNTVLLAIIFGWIISAIAKGMDMASGPGYNAPPPGTQKAEPEPYETQEFDEEWETLCRYDERFAKAREKIAPYGVAAEMELKRVFYHVNDRSRIETIAARLAGEIESGRLDIGELENKHIVQWTQGGSEFERDGDIIIERCGSQEFYWKDGVRYISYGQALQA